MHTETERIFGSLQVLVEPYLTVRLPGHEDGGTIVPFVWDVSEQGEFNIINLCLANGWLQLTDVDIIIKNWQELEYLEFFPKINLSLLEKNIRNNKLAALFQFLQTNLQELESFRFKKVYYPTSSFVIGKTEEGNWICICPTVYTETGIPQELISRSSLSQSTSSQLYGNTVQLRVIGVGNWSLRRDKSRLYMRVLGLSEPY
ncbi:hypothetical protein [Nostoc sp.]|uniref:hypothetical protein n=1 Tax=Nostoc sp. TaxID=1180 RepID=UPI002FF9744F